MRHNLLSTAPAHHLLAPCILCRLFLMLHPVICYDIGHNQCHNIYKSLVCSYDSYYIHTTFFVWSLGHIRCCVWLCCDTINIQQHVQLINQWRICMVQFSNQCQEEGSLKVGQQTEGFTEKHVQACSGTRPQEEGTEEGYQGGLHCMEPAQGRSQLCQPPSHPSNDFNLLPALSVWAEPNLVGRSTWNNQSHHD